MSRKVKRRASLVLLICLLAVLTGIVALRIGTISTYLTPEQATSKLENPAVATPVELLEVDLQEAEQVTPTAETPARVARYINIDMTDEELQELAAIVFLEAIQRAMHS